MTPNSTIDLSKVSKPTLHVGAAHCPMCTHNVPAYVIVAGRRVFVKPGQKCPRCAGTLDAAYVLELDRAA